MNKVRSEWLPWFLRVAGLGAKPVAVLLGVIGEPQ